MNAVVFTKSGPEYELLSQILSAELPGIVVERGREDGRCHLGKEYAVAVVGVDGAQGMEIVCDWHERFRGTMVIWITDDPYFAGVAIRTHIFDFIVRPFTSARFRESVRKLKEGKSDAWQDMPACRKAYR